MYYAWMHFVGIDSPGGYFKGARSAAGWYASYSYTYVQKDIAGIWQSSITKVQNVPAEDFAVKFIVGFAVCIFVTFIWGKFTWFRISAAGLALGVMFGREVWSPFLVVLILKFLTFRMGGTKLYTEKFRPLFIGLVAGYCAMFIIVHPTLHLYSAFLNRW